MKTATDDDYRAWAANLGEIEDRISAEQDAKRVFYANIRATHGKIAADAIKSAMRILRLVDDKREQREQIDAQTVHIVQVLKSSSVGAPVGQAVKDGESISKVAVVEAPKVDSDNKPEQSKPTGLKVALSPKPEIDDLVIDEKAALAMSTSMRGSRAA